MSCAGTDLCRSPELRGLPPAGVQIALPRLHSPPEVGHLARGGCGPCICCVHLALLPAPLGLQRVQALLLLLLRLGLQPLDLALQCVRCRYSCLSCLLGKPARGSRYARQHCVWVHFTIGVSHFQKLPGSGVGQTCSFSFCSLALARSFSRPASLCLSASTSEDALARDFAAWDNHNIVQSHLFFKAAYRIW